MTKLNGSQTPALYTLQSYIVATPPVNSTIYYAAFGFAGVTSANETLSRLYFPRAGKIKRVQVWYRHAGTNGTTETSSLFFRLNNTTDIPIAENIVTATTANNMLYIADLNLDVQAGDFYTIKWQTPAWVTAPGQPVFNCIVLVE